MKIIDLINDLFDYSQPKKLPKKIKFNGKEFNYECTSYYANNGDNIMNFIRIINDPKGIDIGARHITVSTCGIVPKIKDFTKDFSQVNLAISLHAPNDHIRNKIMPISKAYKLNELIESIKEYIKETNRRVTFEYIMLENINDTPECAK